MRRLASILLPFLAATSSVFQQPEGARYFGSGSARERRPPVPNSYVERRFELTGSLRLDSLRIAMDDEGEARAEHNPSGFGAEFQLRMDVTDRELLETDDRLVEIDRYYDRLTFHAAESFDGSDWDQPARHLARLEAATDLEGMRVRFERGPDGWARRLPAAYRHSGKEHLPGLEPEMDLSWLRPPPSVRDGDEWDLPAGDLARTLAPGGAFRWRLEVHGDRILSGLTPDPSSIEELWSMLDGDPRSSLHLRYTSQGSKGGHVHLTGEARAKRALPRVAERWKRDVDDSELELSGLAIQLEVSRLEMELEGHLEYEATAVWDVEQQRFRALDGAGRFTLRARVEFELGGLWPMRANIDLGARGEFAQTIRFDLQ